MSVNWSTKVGHIFMSHCIVVITNPLSAILIPWSKYNLCLYSYIGIEKLLSFDDTEE